MYFCPCRHKEREIIMNHLKNSSTEQIKQAVRGGQQSDIAQEQRGQVEMACIAAARRAPSAHNAQPWRLYPEFGEPDETYGSYRLFYAYADKLLADPDDR